MAPKPQTQTALDERIIEDSPLEKALGDRERAKGAAGEARKKYETMDELVKGKLADLGIEDGDVVRVGDFRIAQTAVEGKSVAFETQPTSRLTISQAGDED